MTIADHDAIALLGDLVSTPSVSGAEHEAVLLLVQRMDALGYRTHIDEAGNAVGAIGSDDPDATEFLLLGHSDTVPGAIPVRIDDGALWGRGSGDAKGPLSAFVIAGASAELPANVRVIVIGAVGESDGVAHLMGDDIGEIILTLPDGIGAPIGAGSRVDEDVTILKASLAIRTRRGNGLRP